jgi:hypothetical protein
LHLQFNVQAAEALKVASQAAEVLEGPASVQVTISVEYSGSNTNAGLLFGEDFAVTCQQRNRARAWVPCVDAPSCRYRWDILVSAAAGLTVLASGDLVGRSKAHAQKRTWHYAVPACIAASNVVVALGDFETYADMQPAATVRAAVAECLAPAEDAAAPAAEALVLEGPVASVTGFARKQDSSAVLEESCRAIRLVQCLLEQWLLCPLPWPLFSIVFLPDWACQVSLVNLLLSLSTGACTISTIGCPHKGQTTVCCLVASILSKPCCTGSDQLKEVLTKS